jgi:hypothetical protein
MTERSYDSKCIAIEQLEVALQLYFEGAPYLSVITLSGAAEEILGKVAKRRGIDTSLESLKNAAVAIHKLLHNEDVNQKVFADRANFARNKLKHINAAEEPTISLDAKQEAIDMLNRAIDNYWLIEKNLTVLMEEFQRGQRDV